LASCARDKHTTNTVSRIVTDTVKVEALVRPYTARYDVILGHDVMAAARMIICCETRTIRWGGMSWNLLGTTTFHNRIETSCPDTTSEIGNDCYTVQLTSKEILSSKYEAVDTQSIAEKQTHLTERQRTELSQLLKHFTTLFSGKLGCYPHETVRLEPNDKAKPFHHRPYPVPHVHLYVLSRRVVLTDAFQAFQDQLCLVGVDACSSLDICITFMNPRLV
jgi:hypothetical protein